MDIIEFINSIFDYTSTFYQKVTCKIRLTYGLTTNYKCLTRTQQWVRAITAFFVPFLLTFIGWFREDFAIPLAAYIISIGIETVAYLIGTYKQVSRKATNILVGILLAYYAIMWIVSGEISIVVVCVIASIIHNSYLWGTMYVNNDSAFGGQDPSEMEFIYKTHTYRDKYGKEYSVSGRPIPPSDKDDWVVR